MQRGGRREIQLCVILGGLLACTPRDTCTTSQDCRSNEVCNTTQRVCQTACNTTADCGAQQVCSQGMCTSATAGSSSSSGGTSSTTSSSSATSSPAPSSSQDGSSAPASSSLGSSSSPGASSASGSSAVSSSSVGLSSSAVASSSAVGSSSSGGVFFDEDLDGIADDVDNCPTVANPDQAHGLDNDPVGDACDPRPDADGDSIAFFDGFNGTTLGGDWNTTGGSWAVANGELTQSQDVDISAGPRATVVLPNANHQVEARYMFLSYGASRASAGPIQQINGSGDGWYCFDGPQDANDGSLAITDLVNGVGALTVLAADPGARPTAGVTELRLKASRVGTTITCSRGTRVVTATSNHTGVSVGVRTRSAAVQFHSVLVYRLGGALP